ncbi:MAG TPA: response regulator, partial [Pseudorhizobium sp.]|nr:response regulator [Pseudorhizobium sp.]
QSVPALDVLVAEDNEVNQIVFTQILQGTGWRFEIVENGARAVEVWQEKDPSLILMDVSMPVMNGHQATQKIREIETRNGGHVPIIGVTAHALESDKELCIAAGMDDYMSKPISPELLEQKIKAWIGERSSSSVLG